MRLFAYPRVKSVVSVSDKVLKMTTSKELLNGFGKEALTVKAVAVYLGAEVRENQEGQFTHQLALLPSDLTQPAMFYVPDLYKHRLNTLDTFKELYFIGRKRVYNDNI